MGRKGKELTNDVRICVCTMFNNGKTVTEVSKDLGIPRGTINSVIQVYKKTGRMKKLPRTGQPEKLTKRDQRTLSRLILANRRAPLKKILAEFNANNDFTISKRTFDRYCRILGFKRAPAGKKQVLNDRHRRTRLAWCRPRRLWTVQDNWSKIIFSDESMIKIGDNYRVYVWKRAGEGYRPDLYGEKENSMKSRFKVMVWGCINWSGVGTLCFVEGNITGQKYLEILEENLWPVIARNFSTGGAIFQDDGAPVHTANIVKNWKRDNEISTLPWPPYSPDLNPIENCWFVIKHQLQQHVLEIKSVQDLQNRIRRIWENLEIPYIQRLYLSMPNRIRQVQILKGHRTKY